MWFRIRFSCKKYPYRCDKGQPSKKREGKGVNELVVRKFSVERLRMALAKMIIVDELSFRFVEHDKFIDFMAKVESRFEVRSHVIVARDCLRLCIKEKDNLIKILMGGQTVCLAIDTWTSIQNLNYICLTVHYIDFDFFFFFLRIIY